MKALDGKNPSYLQVQAKDSNFSHLQLFKKLVAYIVRGYESHYEFTTGCSVGQERANQP